MIMIIVFTGASQTGVWGSCEQHDVIGLVVALKYMPHHIAVEEVGIFLRNLQMQQASRRGIALIGEQIPPEEGGILIDIPERSEHPPSCQHTH